MQYKIGDHVVIKESNVEYFEKFAGKTGVIQHCGGHSDHPYWVKVDDSCCVFCSVERLVNEPSASEKIVITTDGKTTTATKYCEDGKKVTATARCAPEDTFDFNVGAKLAMERLMEAINPVSYEGFKVGDRVHAGKFNGTVICIAENDATSLSNNLGVEFDVVPNHPGIHNCSGITLKAGKIGKNGRCKWCYPKELEHGEYVLKYYNGKIVCVDAGINTNLYTAGKIYEFIDGTFCCDNDEEVHDWNGGCRFTSFNDWKRYSTAKWLEIKE